MASKGKEAFGALSDALETACGWAFCAVALYIFTFANLTGNGTLWDSMRGLVMNAAPAPIETNMAVRLRLVPTRPVDQLEAAQNRMQSFYRETDKEFSVPVLAPREPARAPDQIIAAPMPAAATNDWRKKLTSSLRVVTVYGDGDQRSSVTNAAGSVQGAAKTSFIRSPDSAPIVPASHAGIASAGAEHVSAAGYHASIMTGGTDHSSGIDSGAGDDVRNFR